jgi:ribosome-associated protein
MPRAKPTDLQADHALLPDARRGAAETPVETPSKTRVKQAMQALQELGAELVALPADALARLALDESLHEAVRAAQRIQAHGGRRRQVLYVGKLVRALPEAEQQRLSAALDARRRGHAADAALLHRAEHWRERLMSDDAALTELLRQRPQLDAQQIGQLLRHARQERAQARPPRAYRDLFRLLKGALADDAAAPSAP